MNVEFVEALNELCKTRRIKKEVLLEAIEQALMSAYKKNFDSASNARVTLDAITGEVAVYAQKKVVEQVENPTLERDVESAKKYSKKAAPGDELSIPVETKQFGRIAAQAAKQVIIQGIREAERGIIYDEFNNKQHEVLTGVVNRIDPRTGAVSMRIGTGSDATEAVLTRAEQIPGEVLREGDRARVYVLDVRRSTRGVQIMISRSHPGLVRRLFEIEVPEIFDGTVEIKGIAREAGSRTKMSVWSSQPDVDAIGACVGPRGARVGEIIKELAGEKLDIVEYSEQPETYIANALAPAQVVSVTMLDEGKTCRVIVPDGQLSLAIGREGQNARLAAKLTGYKIDIKPESGLGQ